MTFAVEFALAVSFILLAMSWWPCCCPSGDTCCPCDDTKPSTVTVTLSGFSDNDCDCDPLNATHVLSYTSCNGTPGTLGNNCSWDKVLSIGGAGKCANYYIGLSFAYANVSGTPTMYVAVLIVDEDTTTIAQYYYAISTTEYRADCEATYTLSPTNTFTGACADPSSTTCQVN